MHTTYIGLGSNLGDKCRNLRRAMQAIAHSGVGRITAVSGFYRTMPVDYLAQDWFLNAVIQVETALSPLELLERVKTIEAQLGRAASSIRFGPRPIDLDILLFDQQVVDHPTLIIPHPRMHKRRFVLKPFCDIRPHIIHPVLNVTVGELLRQIDDGNQAVLPAECIEI